MTDRDEMPVTEFRLGNIAGANQFIGIVLGDLECITGKINPSTRLLNSSERV